ncbi:MAG: hypothetical protein ACKVZ0_16725 [Gemmatimonadales bacterium]
MTEPNSPDSPVEPATPSPVEKPRRKIRWKMILLAVVVVPVLLFSLYTALVLNWSYSDGDRSGNLFKFSRKGWLCKTWEGELNITPTAAAPTIWAFTVRDAAVAKQINEVLGSRVVLHYSEHVGVPSSCFGETRYFVDAVRVVP